MAVKGMRMLVMREEHESIVKMETVTLIGKGT
jgi:hypothetical protein